MSEFEGVSKMIRRRIASIVMCGMVFLACSGKSSSTSSKSMEQIYEEQGRPVKVQTVSPKEFSVFLKFPTVLRNQSEAIAYAKIDDIVREIKVKVGDYVTRDQILLSFSSDNASYQQAKLSYENAKATYERSEQLFAQSGISKQDFDNVRTQYELARRALEAMEDIIYVKAPIEGIVSQVYVKTNQNVHPGEPLVSISNKAGFEAVFSVTPDEIDYIKVGSYARIEERGAILEGHVVEIPLVMDPAKGAFSVRAVFAGNSKAFVSGMSVDVAVEIYHNKSAIVIPRNLLNRSDNGYFVYVANGNKAERRDVIIGRERDLEVEVVYGLNPGDKLIVEGYQGLMDNTLINVVK